jgi:hypothetical protein
MKKSRPSRRGADARPYRGKSKFSEFRAQRLPDSPLHSVRWKGLTALEHVRNFVETDLRAGVLLKDIRGQIGPHLKNSVSGAALSRCHLDGRCGCIPCPVCGRLYRIWLISQVLALMRKGVPSKNVVLLLKEADADALPTVDISKTLDRLRKELVRLGFEAVIGNLEAAYKPEKNTWVVHVHLVIFGNLDQQVKALRVAHKDGMPNAVRVYPIRKAVRQTSYQFKFGTYYRAGRKGRAFPMKKRQLEQLFDWTSGATFTAFLLLIGFQRRGSIVPGPGFKRLLADHVATWRRGDGRNKNLEG